MILGIVDPEEQVQTMVRVLKIPEDEARNIVAIEMDSPDGDDTPVVVSLDDNNLLPENTDAS